MPWTNQPQPYRITAVCYAVASWSDFDGNLNYDAIRKTGLTVTQALCERAGMTPPRLRTALTHLPTEGDIRTRTLRWLPRQMSDTAQEQNNARRIPTQPKRYQPPPSAPNSGRSTQYHSRSPGRPIRFRHRPDVAQLAEHGKAWMPWTNQPQPYRITAVCYAVASWSDFDGNLNYDAIRKTGLTVTQALCERAGMTPPRLRTALAQLPTEGDIRTRTLRWLPNQMSDPEQEQHNARRIPAPPEQHQPPPSAPRQRPERTITAEPPRHRLMPAPHPQTSAKFAD